MQKANESENRRTVSIQRVAQDKPRRPSKSLGANRRFMPIRALWDRYCAYPDQRPLVLSQAVFLNRRQPDMLWPWTFRAEPMAYSLLLAIVQTSHAGTALQKLKKASARHAAWSEFWLRFESACSTVGVWGRSWDTVAVAAWLEVLSAYAPDISQQWRTRIQTDSAWQRRWRDTTWGSSAQTQLWTIWVPAEIQGSGSASLPVQDYPDEALQSLLQDYQNQHGFPQFRPSLPGQMMFRSDLSLDRETWCFRFWVPHADRSSMATALERYLLQDLSWGWGSQTDFFGRLIGTDVVQPGFVLEPRLWSVQQG